MARRIPLRGGVSRLYRKFVVFAGAALFALVGLSAAPDAAESFTFSGLQWGISPEEAAKILREKGFKVSKPKAGPATEYVKMNAWLDIRKVDRGKRMEAIGTYLGENVVIDLVFGHNDRLQRVNLRTALWDQTQKGGHKMTKAGEKLVEHFAKLFGAPSDKEHPYGFVDAAQWQGASDGSRVEMFIRGTEGFMFYPPHTTVLNFSFSNGRYSSDASAIASTSSGEAYPVSNQVPMSSDR